MKKLIMSGVFLLIPFSVSAQQEHRHLQHQGQIVEKQHSSNHAENMPGMYGLYPMTREASGTSWQPDSSPQEGVHFMKDDWSFMLHGFANFVYNNQGGDRGDEETFSSNMMMLMGQRDLGKGTLGFRSMMSLDPLQGDDGYALLLQTGETPDGVSSLVDRQHPHDLFMELALTYNIPVSEESSAFAYIGLPGEPALGPPAFMHRFSGMDNPEAPISHHWLDSTHITFGVTTLGYIWRNFKIEGSVFRGREPDEDRWDIETGALDSYSTRLTYNPTQDWSFQISYGDINSPEQLHSQIDTERVTASGTYNYAFATGNWQTMFAWGRNNNDPGHELNAFLLESAVQFNKKHTFWMRAEHAEKDELFHHPHPLGEEIFDVTKASVGYIHDFLHWNEMTWGVGGTYSWHFLPKELDRIYGKTPESFMFFVRVKL
jgi:hypothetical protein